MDTHIDMEENINELAERLATNTMFRAICNGDPQAMIKLQQEGSAKAVIDMRQTIPLGQRQVQSVLNFMVSEDIEKKLEDAAGDNIVYDSLGEHRILGKKKKKKKNMRSY